MARDEDRVRLIAERVAKRVSGNNPASPGSRANGFDRAESHQPAEAPRARVINFVSSTPPLRTKSRFLEPQSELQPRPSQESAAPESILTASPWNGRLPAMLGHNSPAPIPNPQMAGHPSEERFGIEEAAVTELVEFFEKEKQCSVDPSGKPCDHCAMCSSRGF